MTLMIVAAKCAPEKEILARIYEAGLKAVELYLSKDFLADVDRVSGICGQFPLRYALHAPADGCCREELACLAENIKAAIVVVHNVYWDDELVSLVERFRPLPARLCVENTYSIHEPVKFMRRFGLGRCLDLEHLQMETLGVFEDVFVAAMKEACHIHLTGYEYGTDKWHTPIHYSPRHSRYLLHLLKKAGYKGFVVSEAQVSYQNLEEFKKLKEFFDNWQKNL